MKPYRTLLTLAFAAALAAAAAADTPPVHIPFDRLADRIVTALKVEKGERVLLRYDPETLGPLEPVLREKLTQQGAIVRTLKYGPAPDFESELAQTDIYIWLPAGSNAATPPEQRALLARWLDEGRGRQIHFHWNGGTQDRDGRPGVHSPEFDRIYVDALDIDYEKLSRDQDKVIAALRSGEVRVTTPGGTDVRFRVGDRPFNKQDGDASKARMASARVRVDREIELPAGVIRVAPIESSVDGVIVVPKARLLDDAVATGIRLEFRQGKIVKATAAKGQEALDAYLASSPALTSFRELGLGLNPKLVADRNLPFLPYYGYGDAVVRLSLGDNTEVGGAVRGGGSRWLFFDDATITVGGERIVENGRLAAAYR
ncbi:MAG TPA: aminopeptidase [Vicinamibacterales bacterium]